MDWFNDLVSAAGSELKQTGVEYVQGNWEREKEKLLGSDQVEDKNTAALPAAHDQGKLGSGRVDLSLVDQSKSKIGSLVNDMTWQKAGVIVGAVSAGVALLSIIRR